MSETLQFRPYETAMAPDVVALWNRTIGDVYPLSERMLRQVIDLNPSYRPSDATTVWVGDRLVGFGLLHRYREDEAACRELAGLAWLTAVLVAPERQRQGIGTRIGMWLREGVADLPDDRLRPGGGLHHFFPGPPEELPAARPFLESLGFAFGDRRVCDVRVDLSTYQHPEGIDELLARHGLDVSPCRPEQWDRLIALLGDEFSANWRCRAEWFHRNDGDPADWLVLRRGEEVLGFSQCHHPGSAVIGPARYWAPLRGPHAGGLGPIGVSPSLRGLGLGRALLQLTLDRLRSLGVDDVVADWTNLLDFYARVGMRPWKCYAVGG